MQVTVSDRGFERIALPKYTEPHEPKRLVGQSSAIGDYPDSFDRPGSSFLWIDEHHHLNREQVAELVKHLKAWLKTGSLEV